MITPKEIPLTIYQGASFYKEWELKDKEGNPISLTGCSAQMQIRKKIDSAESLLDLTTENGLLFISSTAEKTTYGIDIPPEDTQTLVEKKAVYDLEIVFADGGVARIQQGPIVVDMEVTRL